MIALPGSLLILVLALALDRLFGEPRWLWQRLPHPVVLIGRAIDTLEHKLNVPALSFAERRMRGAAAVLLLVACGLMVGLALNVLLPANRIGWVLEALVVAILLAHKSLVDHVSAVADALQDEGLQGGRRAVAHIVGRDVSALDDAGVARAAIESGAENFSDGLVGPALFYLILGLPGLLVFKIASTADSMIGYRSERYAAFGWAAARLDDVLNWIPARLSAGLLAAAAALNGLPAQQAVACARRDARLHKSPNAGWPEAAAAGALGLALGGPRRYGDVEIDGAWFNEAGRQDARVGDLRAAVRLMDGAWTILVVITALLGLAALWLGQ